MRDPAGYFWRLGRGSASVWWPRGIKCTGSLPASTPSCAGMSCHAPYWTRGVTPGRHFSQHPWALVGLKAPEVPLHPLSAGT